MQPYIEQEGSKIVMNEENQKDPNKFTEKLLKFKEDMDNLIQEAFSNDIKFQKSRDQSFQNFMNKFDNTAYNIALYSDFQMKTGLKQMSDEQIDQILSAIVRIFCCLHGRDKFINAYTNFLSHRLLNKTSVSNYAEESMIQKLQIECGHNTVNKIKTMIQDMNKSEQVMQDFRTMRGGNTVDGMEFNTKILTSSHWPISEIPKCNIPR